MTAQSETSPTLAAFWPFFLLSEERPAQDAATLLDQLCPPDLNEMRLLFGNVFHRVCPDAETGLTRTDDATLTYWQRIIRSPQFTGEREQLAFLPTWCQVDGFLLVNVARLLALPWYTRADVFMAAMQQAAA